VDRKAERIEKKIGVAPPADTAVVAEPANTDLVHLEIGEPGVGAQARELSIVAASTELGNPDGSCRKSFTQQQ